MRKRVNVFGFPLQVMEQGIGLLRMSGRMELTWQKKKAR